MTNARGATTWTPERREKFEATMAKRPRPIRVCRTCPRLLTSADIKNDCVRCTTCRSAQPHALRVRAPIVQLNPEKPVGLKSWWVENQSHEHRDEWFATAEQEFKARMITSLEARQIGHRPSLDEQLLKYSRRGMGGGWRDEA